MPDLVPYTKHGIVKYVQSGPPGFDVLGANVNELWCDKDSGKLFRCTDATFGVQQWLGTDGVTYPGPAITSQSHPNLVRYYSMDNISGSTLIDGSPSGQDATIVGATTVAGKIGNALSCDGVDDYIDIPITGLTTQTVGAFSVWMDVVDTTAYLVSGYSGLSGQFLIMGIHNATSPPGAWIYHSSTEGNAIQKGGGGAVSLGQFHHLVAQPNAAGTDWEAWLNGSAVSLTTLQTTGSGGVPGAWFNDVLSMDYCYLSRRVLAPIFATGKYDIFRLFDRRLTSTEVGELYNGGLGA